MLKKIMRKLAADAGMISLYFSFAWLMGKTTVAGALIILAMAALATAHIYITIIWIKANTRFFSNYRPEPKCGNTIYH